MRKIGAMKLHRLLALVLALVMGAAALPAQAATLAGWENITVNAVYTDEHGEMVAVPAIRVPQDQMTYTWWIQLPETALDTVVTLQVVHPDPAYTYWTNDWTLNLNWFSDKNATAVDEMYTYYVGYSYNGTRLAGSMDDYMKILLSTMEPPFEYTEADVSGGVMLPAGDEGFGEVPGVEMIVPVGPQGGTSAPAAPVTATVTVYYKHVNGQTLDVRDASLTGVGVHTLWPESDKVAGLNLSGAYSHTVTVYEGGWTDVSSVTFLYEDVWVAPKEATIDVYYYHQDGYQLDHQTVTLQPGTNPVTPRSGAVAELELISDETVTVWVDDSGNPDLASVSFLYRTPVQQVTEVTVTAFVFDTMGNEIAARRQHTLSVGAHTIEAPAGYETPGWELISEAVIEVTVNPDGTYWPSGEELSFWYRPAPEEEEIVVPVTPVVTETPAPQTATVTLRYLDSRGYPVADAHTVTLGEGSHTITPDNTRIPAGYTIMAGTEMHTVNVRNGRANPDTVTFYFAETQQAVTPTSFQVTVYYYDTYGNEIAPRQTLTFAPGTHWVQANPQNLPAGYELVSEGGFNLTVRQDGSLDRAAEDVGFWYTMQQVTPKNAVITVRYVDGNGRMIAGPFSQELTGGQSHQIQPDVYAVPEAYDVSGEQPVTVSVSMEGYASPATVSFVAELRRSGETMPVGVQINRYGAINANSVALRSEPSTTKSNTVLQRVQRGQMVYVVTTQYNAVGEQWAQVIVGGRAGYMMTSFIDLLTPVASDVYMASTGATPVPTFTPTPTPEPTESIIEFITPVPLTPAPIVGYAVLRSETALRTGTSVSEMTLTMLEAEELVTVTDNYVTFSGESWSLVRTLDNLTGYVPTSALRQVSEQEADWRYDYWYQQHPTTAPVPQVTSTPEPMQLQGYGLTIAANVPLRRMASEQSRIVDNLPYGTVIYITGQTYVDGIQWQNVAVNGESGYIRGDLVRLMTEREETDYLNSLNYPAPTITPTQTPYDRNGLSSYGYVTTNSVNFRESTSTSSKKLATLNAYAMALVLGSERVDGVTWYHVIIDNVEGYVHGNYFHQMTLQEFTDFYGSDRYYQGIANNSGSQGSSGNTGSTGSGGQVSQEDQVVNDWYSSGSGVQPSFAPFVPVETVKPINPTATPTLEPLPGYVTQGTRQPTATPTRPVGTGFGQVGDSSSELPLPGATGSVNYPVQDAGNGGNAWVWIIVVVFLALAVGVAIAVMSHQRKQQQIALKAAQRRARQAANGGGRPYAGQGMPPRTGAYPNYGQNAPQPLFPQMPPQQAPGYPNQTPPTPPATPNQTAPTGSVPVVQRPVARQATSNAPAPTARRTGRRTAWQQANADQQDVDDLG